GHVVQHVVGVGSALQHLVHQGHDLGAGDEAVGSEGAVRIAGNPALVGRTVDVIPGPVVGDVGELIRTGVLGVGELSRHHGELGAGDVGSGVEHAAGTAQHQVAVGHGGNGVVGPAVGR